jgi:hypothetical protein
MSKRSNKTLRWARGDLNSHQGGEIPRQTLEGCCGKKQYATEAAALAALNRFDALSENRRTPTRAYRCDYGWWHITSSQYRPSPHPRGTGETR